jgi:protein TonB
MYCSHVIFSSVPDRMPTPTKTRITMTQIGYPQSAGLSLLLHVIVLLILGLLSQQPWTPQRIEAQPVALDIIEPSHFLGSGDDSLLPGPAPLAAPSPSPPSVLPRQALPSKPKIAMHLPPKQPPAPTHQNKTDLPALPPATASEASNGSVAVPASQASESAETGNFELSGFPSGTALSKPGVPGGNGSGEIGTGGTGTGSGYVGAGIQIGERPAYPQDARQKGIEGTVVLRILVGKDGNPASVTVRRSSGYPTLDQASLQAAAKWRFSPARKNGQAIASFHDVRIRFCLDDVQ